MFRTLRSIPLMSCLLGSIGCHAQPAPVPVIHKDDYSAIIRYLQKHIPQEMARYDVPGLSIALLNGQELIWARGFGYADKARGVPVSANTVFRAGAISKLLTATAVLQLSEQHKLQLDAPLQDTLKEFYVRSRFHNDQHAADQAITLRRLLSHQAGLPSDYLRDLNTPYALSQMPMRVSGVWLSMPPGTQVAYSNLGYTLLGAAIERTTQEDFETVLQRNLLQPLDMGQSSFAGNRERSVFRAQGYQDGSPSIDAEVRDFPANGLWASPKDLSRYVQMLFAQGTYKQRQVLSRASVEAMFTQQNAGNVLDFDCRIGLAWFLTPCGEEPVSPGVRTFQHSGNGKDFSAQVTLLPDSQLAVVIMTNADSGEELVPALSTLALRMMLQASSGELPSCSDCRATPLHQRSTPVAHDRKRLAGFYATAWGIFRIKEQGERLVGELSGSRFELLRDEHGWLRAQKKWLGFWPQDLGELGRVQLDVLTVQGRQMLTAKSHGQLMAVGERISPPPLSGNWANTIGRYQVLNTGETDAALDGLTIHLEDGFLVASAQLDDQPLADYILLPVDNAHAVLAGNGHGLGDTVSRQINGLSASGYRFKRINHPTKTVSF